MAFDVVEVIQHLVHGAVDHVKHLGQSGESPGMIC